VEHAEGIGTQKIAVAFKARFLLLTFSRLFALFQWFPSSRQLWDSDY
jgi:hypothetical protein